MTETPEALTGTGAHELSYSIKELTGVVRGLREDMQKHQNILFGPNSDAGMVVSFRVLEAKAKTAFWMAGVAFAAVVTSAVGIAFYIVINYGPKGTP